MSGGFLERQRGQRGASTVPPTRGDTVVSPDQMASRDFAPEDLDARVAAKMKELDDAAILESAREFAKTLDKPLGELGDLKDAQIVAAFKEMREKQTKLSGLSSDARVQQFAKDIKALRDEKPDGENLLQGWVVSCSQFLKVLEEKGVTKMLKDTDVTQFDGGSLATSGYVFNKFILSPTATGLNIATKGVEASLLHTPLAVLLPAAVAPVAAVAIATAAGVITQGVGKPGRSTKARVARNATLLGLAAGTFILMAPTWLRATLNAGIAGIVSTKANEAAKRGERAVVETQREAKAYPVQARTEVQALYEKALEKGGVGHGPRTYRVVQILSGDTFIEKGTNVERNNRDAYILHLWREKLGRDTSAKGATALAGATFEALATQKVALEKEFSSQLAEFDRVATAVKAMIAKFNEGRPEGAKIPAGKGFIWLVEHESSQIQNINADAARGKADVLRAGADAFGQTTITKELWGGADPMLKELREMGWQVADPRYALQTIGTLGHLFTHESRDPRELEPLDEAMLKAFDQLSTQLQAVTFTRELSRFSELLKASRLAEYTAPKTQRNPNPQLETLIDELKIPDIKFSLTPEMVQTLGIKWGELDSVTRATFMDRLSFYFTGKPDSWRQYIGQSVDNAGLPLISHFNIDMKQPGSEQKLALYFTLLILSLFFVAPAARLGSNRLGKSMERRMRENDDANLHDAEKDIGKSLLLVMRTRQQQMIADMLRAGIQPNPLAGSDESMIQTLADMIRARVVSGMNVPAESKAAMDAFVARKAPIPTRLSEQYANAVMGMARDLRTGNSTAVANGLLADLESFAQGKEGKEPDSAAAARNLRNQLEMLSSTTVPEVRNGLAQTVKAEIERFSNAFRLRELATVGNTLAHIQARRDVIQKELTTERGDSGTTITPRTLLLEEALAQADDLSARWTQLQDRLKKPGDSISATPAVVLDPAEAKQLLDEIARQELSDTWNVGPINAPGGTTTSGTANLEAAAQAQQALWRELVGNENRLKDAYIAQVGGGVTRDNISIRRVDGTKGPSLAFVDVRDGSQLVYEETIPSNGHASVSEIVPKIEGWLSGGAASITQRLKSLHASRVAEFRAAIQALPSEVERVNEHTYKFSSDALTNADQLSALNLLTRRASIVRAQRRILEQVSASPRALSQAENRVMTNPETSRYSGLYTDSIEKTLAQTKGVRFELDTDKGEIAAFDATDNQIAKVYV